MRGNCEEVPCTWGNWVFHWFMHSKQIYEPRETFEFLLSPEITLLLTKPFLPCYPLGISRAWAMGYKDNTWFCWIFNGFFFFFLAENLNIHLGFPICQPRSSSQGFKRTHQGHRVLMFILLHILWSNQV